MTCYFKTQRTHNTYYVSGLEKMHDVFEENGVAECATLV